MLAGLSVASFFTIAGAIAVANQPVAATQSPAPTPADNSAAGQGATPRATANRSTPTVVHTTTRGS
jgi:hypothetical protein